MFGTCRTNTINAYGDGRRTTTIGNDTRFYKIALPNAYIDVFAPFGNGLTAQLGRFYTIMGYETGLSRTFFIPTRIPSIRRPLPYRGYVHYPVVSNLLVTLGAVTGGHNQFGGSLDGNAGWDGFDRIWRTGIFWAAFSGVPTIMRRRSDSRLSPGMSTPITTSTIFAGKRVSTKGQSHLLQFHFQAGFHRSPHYVFQHDHGIEQQHPLNNFKDAQWYGIQQQLIYEVTDTVGVGLRGEWFRDDDGVRVGQMCPGCAVLASGPASYYGVTLGVIWKPVDWVVLRPEVRYDWADGMNATTRARKASAFVRCRRGHQVLRRSILRRGSRGINRRIGFASLYPSYKQWRCRLISLSAASRFPPAVAIVLADE